MLATQQSSLSLHQRCFRNFRKLLSVQIYQSKEILFLIFILCYAAVVRCDKRTVTYNLHLPNFLLHFIIDWITFPAVGSLTRNDSALSLPFFRMRSNNSAIRCFSRLRFSGVLEQFSSFTIACLTAISTGSRIRITQLNVLKNTRDGVEWP